MQHLYASISSLTKAVSEREAAAIQRSSTLLALPRSTSLGTNAAPSSFSHRSTFCTRNLRQAPGGDGGGGSGPACGGSAQQRAMEVLVAV